MTNRQSARPIAAMCALFAACALVATDGARADDTIEISHARGVSQIPDNPGTIISFDAAAIDILDALDVPITGVPAFDFPSYLDRYEGDETLKAGSLFEPDFEVVHAAQPDLVIVALRSSPHYDALAEMAPTLDLTFGPEAVLDSIFDNTRELARITGREEAAETLIADVDAAVAEVRAKTANAGSALIIMTSGGKVTAFGPGSRFGFLHDVLGFRPAVEGLAQAGHGEAVSFEFIYETNPDWLFVIDRDAAIGSSGQAAREVLNNDLVAATDAWSADRVIYLDAGAWYIVGGGISAVGQAVAQINAALDADAKD